jgi:hypothetical protein
MLTMDKHGRLVTCKGSPDLEQKVQVILEATRLAPELSWTWARMAVAIVVPELAAELYAHEIEDVQSIIFRFFPGDRPKILTAICSASSNRFCKLVSVRALLELVAERAAEEGEYDIYGIVVNKMYVIACGSIENTEPFFLQLGA